MNLKKSLEDTPKKAIIILGTAITRYSILAFFDELAEFVQYFEMDD